MCIIGFPHGARQVCSVFPSSLVLSFVFFPLFGVLVVFFDVCPSFDGLEPQGEFRKFPGFFLPRGAFFSNAFQPFIQAPPHFIVHGRRIPVWVLRACREGPLHQVQTPKPLVPLWNAHKPGPSEGPGRLNSHFQPDQNRLLAWEACISIPDFLCTLPFFLAPCVTFSAPRPLGVVG